MAENTLSIREKIGYGMGDAGCNIIFGAIMLFVNYFYTDIFGLAPALVGRWPADDPEAGQTLLAGLDTAISSLPAPMQQEIGELFAFLSFPPVRWLYLRLPAWDRVRPDAAAQALARLQAALGDG